MRDSFFRSDPRSCGSLLLLLCLCVGVSAQTTNYSPRRGNRAHQGGNPEPAGSPPVSVSSGDWSQLAKFSESKFYIPCCSEFGTAVAISGETIVVSDSDPDAPGSAAFVFVKPANGWKNATPTATLSLPEGGFGDSVAISGDTIVVGAYVYVKPAEGWTNMNPTATLKASDGAPIGSGVAISGNTIVLTDSFAHMFTGAAYVFVKPASGWRDMVQTAKLSASDGEPHDYLGGSVSIDGATIALGATQPLGTGRAYVYVEPVGGWTDMTQTAELTASNAQRHSDFGSSISVSGNEVLVGASNFDSPGAAYMFVEPPGGWVNATETARLFPVDPNQYAEYGLTVAVDGNHAAVGAPFFSNGRFYDEGGIYVFTEPAAGWHDMSSATVVTGSDARHNTWFGKAVALNGKSLVVGAPWIVFHAAYVFELP